jgi:PAS domain S-box-containing protein
VIQEQTIQTNEILEAIEDVFYILNADWTFRYVNQTASRQWSLPVASLIGQKIWDVFPHALDSYPYRQLKKVMRSRQTLHFETLSPILETWIDVHVYPISDGGLVVYFRDIHDRKLAEDALKASEERFTKAFGASPMGLAISHRVTGKIDEVNHSFERITEYSRADVLGKTSFELALFVDPSDRQKVVRRLKSNPQGVHTQTDIQTKKGKIRKVNLYIAPLGSDQGDYMLTLIQDITDQSRMEREAQMAAAESELHHRLLEQREAERIRIARDLHDGPIQELTATTFSLETLALDSPDPHFADQLRQVRVSLQQQIAELRAYAGELRPPALTKFGLEKAIRLHAESFIAQHPEIAVHIRSDQETGEIPDEIRLALYRIYQEAMNNIAKHARATDVLILLKQNSNKFRLEIIDNGEGFTPPSDWLALARSGHLGLVGMRERAVAIGGRLSISSNSKKGTHLTVSVPLR